MIQEIHLKVCLEPLLFKFPGRETQRPRAVRDSKPWHEGRRKISRTGWEVMHRGFWAFSMRWVFGDLTWVENRRGTLVERRPKVSCNCCCDMFQCFHAACWHQLKGCRCEDKTLAPWIDMMRLETKLLAAIASNRSHPASWHWRICSLQGCSPPKTTDQTVELFLRPLTSRHSVSNSGVCGGLRFTETFVSIKSVAWEQLELPQPELE